MGKIRRLVAKLSAEARAEVIERQLLVIIKDNEASILDLNLEQLLNTGTDAEGNKLDFYKSASYAELKLSLNPNGVTDLRLTGAFHRGFYVDAGSFPVTIWSTDSKTEELVAKYGEEIFGLNVNNLKKAVQDYLKEDIGKYYRSLIRV